MKTPVIPPPPRPRWEMAAQRITDSLVGLGLASYTRALSEAPSALRAFVALESATAATSVAAVCAAAWGDEARHRQALACLTVIGNERRYITEAARGHSWSEER